MERQVLSVTELNNRIKGLLERDPMLAEVCVRGELSNYKIYPSGHHYFTLKDSESSLRCVMFKGSAMKLRFRPESGMGVTAFGRVSVYPRDGAYQLYCTALQPEGAGDLQVAFEQLKAKLAAEGLFDRAHKKPLPPFPEKIAIITSSAGAAVHDMIRILGQRWPMTSGRDPLRKRVSRGRPHHHRARRRLHRGSLGLQRRARGAGDLRLRAAGDLRRGA